jgi:UPF0271 protein
MGEGMPNDEALIIFISSANIACGFHAGDEALMKKTVQLAKQYNVAIGAHPGFPDKENFGRTEINFSPTDIYRLVSDQIKLLQTICKDEEVAMHHVKPHGALYNMASKNAEIAHAISSAIYDLDTSLILYGLSGSSLIIEAKAIGLKTASEVFADRTYQNDGSLTVRSQTNALIEEEETSIKQVLQMIQIQTVTSVNNVTVPIKAETICIHGDSARAVQFTKSIHQILKENGITIKPI